MPSLERYSRQIVLWRRGEEDQIRLLKSSVAIIGCGALGSCIAELLTRAGVGRIKLIDRDVVDLTNLQRQVLFDEYDAEKLLPKAIAAANKLRAVNSEVEILPIVEDVNPSNVLELIKDVDLVIDATDNLETRFLINDACHKLGKPWIHGAVLRTYGMVMNIIPGETPCLRCLIPNPPPPGSLPTCETAGIMNTIVMIVSSIQATEALKFLMGYDIVKNELIYIDAWNLRLSRLKVRRREKCPLCSEGRYEYLEGRRAYAQALCGRNAVQILPSREIKLNLEELAQRLSRIGKASYNGYILSFDDGRYRLILFPDGRAIIKGTSDVKVAKSVYTRYVGG
ncbi:MAG: hypothetical protein DRN15_08935 [Thermoprotei archaeon]|nr:MAG: hypothetical protein DRN15_08935 [Thermoprotei archaeon]RLF22899.1 MAG: hypothetical protein DRM97_05295 [Thermoprotei archaeon]